MKHPRIAAILTALLVLSNYSVADVSLLEPEKPKLKVLPVPIVRQATPFSCGAAALQAVLLYWQVNTEGELALHEPLQTDKDNGTHPESILKIAKTLGLKADLKIERNIKEIEYSVDKKEPVIVDYQAWGGPEIKDYSDVWDSGHYGVVVGYDENYLYLMDPLLPSSYGKIEKGEFQKRWHDVETRNGKLEYFIRSAIFISGAEGLKAFPAEIKAID